MLDQILLAVYHLKLIFNEAIWRKGIFLHKKKENCEKYPDEKTAR